MLRVGVGVQEAYGDRLYSFMGDFIYGAIDIGGLQRPEHFAFVVQPFTDFEPQLTFDQRGRLFVVQVVEPGNPVAAQLQNVAEPLGGDEGGIGALVFDDGIGGYGEAVAYLRYSRWLNAKFVDTAADALKHAPAVVVWGTGDLPRQHSAVVGKENDVGESSADVYANPVVRHKVFSS